MMRIPDIEARIDVLTTQILVPLRATKDIDLRAVGELHTLVDELAAVLGNAPDIPRQLTGKLLFIFTQMLSEADHTRFPEEILECAWEYEDRLEKIFDPTFSSSPPTPGVPKYY